MAEPLRLMDRIDPRFLIAWREKNGYSQAKLASALMVDLSTIKRMEAGRRAIHLYIGLALAALEHGLKPVGMSHVIPKGETAEGL